MTGAAGTKGLWSPKIASAFDPDAEAVIAPDDFDQRQIIELPAWKRIVTSGRSSQLVAVGFHQRTRRLSHHRANAELC
ncbi:MAG: hypothetical protein AAB401_10515 [Acidobacteriota bacterium]